VGGLLTVVACAVLVGERLVLPSAKAARAAQVHPE